jgi:hypothetical protein
MTSDDKRCEHIGWVEIALQTANPDIPYLQILGQSNYGPPDRIAFIQVYGLDYDRTRRRQLRSKAEELLRELGYAVKLEAGRDVYDLEPIRPSSAHEQLLMLESLRIAVGVSSAAIKV